MEQNLIYLAIAFIVGLVIVLVMTFHRLNKLKLQFETSYSSNSELWEKYLLIYDKYEKSTSILSEYEKTNVLQIKEINELNEECDRYLTSSNGYQLKCNELDAELDAYATKISEYELENIDLKEELDDKIVFINALNGRLQKAEAERDKLQSKLSRKGLGKKGRKKNESFAYDYKTEILKGA